MILKHKSNTISPKTSVLLEFFLCLRRTAFHKTVGGVELTAGFHTFENDPIFELTGK